MVFNCRLNQGFSLSFRTQLIYVLHLVFFNIKLWFNGVLGRYLFYCVTWSFDDLSCYRFNLITNHSSTRWSSYLNLYRSVSWLLKFTFCAISFFGPMSQSAIFLDYLSISMHVLLDIDFCYMYYFFTSIIDAAYQNLRYIFLSSEGATNSSLTTIKPFYRVLLCHCLSTPSATNLLIELSKNFACFVLRSYHCWVYYLSVIASNIEQVLVCILYPLLIFLNTGSYLGINIL